MKKEKKAKVSAATEAEATALNYSVLARYDPLLAQIFFKSAICNVYKFDLTSSEWQKLEFQGTVFVYSRATKVQPDGSQPTAEQIADAKRFPYALLVLNRLNVDNFWLGITPESVGKALQEPEMQVQLDDPFLMVETAHGDMYGLWLFSEADRTVAQQTLEWCLAQDL